MKIKSKKVTQKKRFFRGIALFLFIIISYTNVFAAINSYVLKHDLKYYSPEIQRKIAIRVFERRAYVYSVFKKFDKALECIAKAEKLAPEKAEYYAYLKKEIKLKMKVQQENKNEQTASNNLIIKVRHT